MSKPQQGFHGRSMPMRPGGHHNMVIGKPAKAENAKATLKRVWEYMSNQKGKLIMVFVTVLLSACFQLSGPFLLGISIDRYIIPGDISGLLRIILLMIVVYIMQAVATWLQNYWMIGVSQQTVKQIRSDAFAKLQKLPLKFFDSRPHGEIMSRLTNDVDNISNTLNTSTTQVFSSIITVTGTILMMLWLSPLLTLVSVVTIPLMFFSTRKLAGPMGKYFGEQQKKLGQLNGIIEETISGQKVVKAFAREDKIEKQFNEINRQLKKAGIRAQILSGIIPPLMNVFNNLSFAIIAGAGGWLTVKGVLTVGVIASFINYSKQFTRPLNELANQVNMLLSAIAGAERVFEILDECPESQDDRFAVELSDIQGKVDFEGVSFSYQKDIPVLKNVNLKVKPGQTIAFVGPTGAGKTTMINMLTRFYDVDGGVIKIDNVDIRNIKRNSLRSLLGVVLQDTYLFADTVRENIRYGRLDATDSEVEMAARMANAEHFIMCLPQGYDTILSEDGNNLSQGQRQLLNIARAILADPAILILDEATSSVDTRTEVHIQEALLNLMKGRTSFVIAHRLSTIQKADKIVVIQNGEIAEQGTHEELLNMRGFYYCLYNTQFQMQSA